MRGMVESIKGFGVLTPAVVRKKDDGRYELISGHRRKRACELAELEQIPCIIREMSRDEAIIFMVDSNLQREIILPSEKAKSYQMRLEAMKRQGERTDLTSAPMVQKSESKTSREILAEKTGESHEQIRRYIRLNSLIPEISAMVDENKIGFRPAVELSYLPEKEQKDLLETMMSEESTPSLAQAIKMKKFSKDGRLNDDVILSIMSEEKPNQKEQIKIPRERVSKFFKEDTPVEKITEIIIKALEKYRKREEQER